MPHRLEVTTMEIVYVYTKLRSEFGKHTGHFEDAPARPEWTIEPNEEVRWPLWGAASFFVFVFAQRRRSRRAGRPPAAWPPLNPVLPLPPTHTRAAPCQVGRAGS